ncbi:MAG: hypothetical protein FJX23_04285 [Alphaproteobacteria bacterium]|nr:hypothetical protein [Alphaproteobacteria bacterium]
MLASDSSNEEVAKALSESDGEPLPVAHLSLTNSLSGAEGGRLLADYLDTHPHVENLLMFNCPIGDEGIAALAPAIARHPNLLKLSLKESGVSRAGVKRFFEEGGFTVQLLEFGFKESQSPEAEAEITSRMERVTSKNLMSTELPAAPILAARIEKNFKQRAALIQTLLDVEIKDLDAPQLRNVYDRRHSLLYHEDDWQDVFEENPFNSTRDPEEDQRFVRSRFQFAQSDLENVMKAMPGLPSAPEDFFTPNDSGFAPLDNPALWAGKTIKDLSTIPLTRALLEAKTAKDTTLLDSAFHGLPAGDVMDYLNSQGVHLRSDKLLDEEGKAAPLLEQLIDDGKAPALFTPDNWRGASRGEILKVYQALPETQQQNAGIHTLLQQMSTGQHRQGR